MDTFDNSKSVYNSTHNTINNSINNGINNSIINSTHNSTHNIEGAKIENTLDDTFDGSKPNLISSKTIKDIESKLDFPENDEGNRVLNGLGSFYTNYIAPNMFPLIVIGLLVVYLILKYVLKKDREEREDEEDEKKTKRVYIKKQMVKVDPDKLLQNIKTNKDKEIEKQEEKANDKENTDISNMISDDYLLSNDELSEDDNEYDNEYIKKETTHVDASTLLQNRGATYGMDEAASLVFGKGE
jgi:hypothetical protein